MSAYYYQETNSYNDPSMQQVVYSQMNPMDDYMLPEEEWEREAVLDPAWERQQKKVSRSRMNSSENPTFFCFQFEDIHSLV